MAMTTPHLHSFSLLPMVFLVAISGCDYAPAKQVNALSRDVQSIKSEQSIIRTQVDAGVEQQKSMLTSLSAMGTGFNVLSETVVDQDVRVDKLESNTGQIKRQLARIGTGTSERRGGQGSASRGYTPDLVGMYTGTRVDAQTQLETPMRMQWCEGEEGSTGYLAQAGEDPDYTRIKCWRFGSVALFREETGKGAQVQCLRDVTVDEAGDLRALDCDKPGVWYRMTLR